MRRDAFSALTLLQTWQPPWRMPGLNRGRAASSSSALMATSLTRIIIAWIVKSATTTRRAQFTRSPDLRALSLPAAQTVDRSEAEHPRAQRTARMRSRHVNSAPRPFRAVKGSSDGHSHQTPPRLPALHHGAGRAPGSIALAHRHADNLTAMQRNASNSSATRGKQRWTLHTFCAPTQLAAQHAQRPGSACHTSGATARSTAEKSTPGNTPPKAKPTYYKLQHAPETPRCRRARDVSPLPRALARTAVRLSGGRLAGVCEQPAAAMTRRLASQPTNGCAGRQRRRRGGIDAACHE